MYSEINFSTAAEPRLFLTTLSSFVKEQQMAHYGAIIICRSGKANIQVNFDDWQLFEGAVITIFPNDVMSPRMREMFNRFMMLVERDYKLSRDVAYYASQMNITPKYLTLIVRQMTHETPKHIIDHYTILQLKLQLTASRQSVKEIAWEYHFNDVSFFCRYFKRHTGLTPMEIRTVGNG